MFVASQTNFLFYLLLTVTVSIFIQFHFIPVDFNPIKNSYLLLDVGSKVKRNSVN